MEGYGSKKLEIKTVIVIFLVITSCYMIITNNIHQIEIYDNFELFANSVEISSQSKLIIKSESFEQFKILFDEAHLPQYSVTTNADYTRNYYTYGPFTSDLIKEGHSYDILSPGMIINQSFLSNYDLLIISGSTLGYHQSEIDSIVYWIKAGGNLLLLFSYDYNNLRPDLYDGLDGLADRLGFSINGRYLVDSDDGSSDYYKLGISFDNIANHTIANGVNTIYSEENYYLSQQPNEAIGLVKTDLDGTAYIQNYLNSKIIDKPIISAIGNTSNIKGRLIISSTCKIFAHKYVFNPFYDSMYDPPQYYFREDNKQLALNSIKWLLDKNNVLDIDSDLDGLTDYRELNYFKSNPYSIDTDLDNLNDTLEAELGLLLYTNDTDDDLLSDYDEYYIYPTNPKNEDTDHDNLLDGEEILIYSTNPLESDTDFDEMPDEYEVRNLLDPINSTDAFTDLDGDMLINLDEYRYKADPNLNDTDHDLINDYDEVYVYHTRPYYNDSDIDTLTDYEEVFIFGTNPLKLDTDGDGYNDGEEVVLGTDPLNPDDPPKTTNLSRTTIEIALQSKIIIFIQFFVLASIILKIRREKK